MPAALPTCVGSGGIAAGWTASCSSGRCWASRAKASSHGCRSRSSSGARSRTGRCSAPVRAGSRSARPWPASRTPQLQQRRTEVALVWPSGLRTSLRETVHTDPPARRAGRGVRRSRARAGVPGSGLALRPAQHCDHARRRPAYQALRTIGDVTVSGWRELKFRSLADSKVEDWAGGSRQRLRLEVRPRFCGPPRPRMAALRTRFPGGEQSVPGRRLRRSRGPADDGRGSASTPRRRLAPLSQGPDRADSDGPSPDAAPVRQDLRPAPEDVVEHAGVDPCPTVERPVHRYDDQDDERDRERHQHREVGAWRRSRSRRSAPKASMVVSTRISIQIAGIRPSLTQSSRSSRASSSRPR